MRGFPYRAHVLLSFVAMIASTASASFHVMDINEVYSNADGSVQYVELIARAAGQGSLAQARVVGRNADGTVLTIVIDIATNFLQLDNGETVLIATPAFESVAGFAPDFVMPACSLVSFPAGKVTWQNDSGTIIADSVAYGAFTGSNAGFGSPAAGLPTDGLNSVTRIASNVVNDNSVDFGVRAATPRRNDGTTGALTGVAPHDCDASGAADACEIAAGGLADENDNGIPDVCEDRGDFDGDGDVDLADYVNIFDCFDGPLGGIRPGCDEEDLHFDETIDLVDAAAFLNAFGTPPP